MGPVHILRDWLRSYAFTYSHVLPISVVAGASHRVGGGLVIHALRCLYWVLHSMGSETSDAALGRIAAILEGCAVFHRPADRALHRTGDCSDHLYDFSVALCIILTAKNLCI